MTTKRHCNHCDGTLAPRWIQITTFRDGPDPRLQTNQHVFANDVAKLDGDFCSPGCLMTWVAAAFPTIRSILDGATS